MHPLADADPQNDRICGLTGSVAREKLQMLTGVNNIPSISLSRILFLDNC